MKKIIIFLFCIISVVFSFYGCRKKTAGSCVFLVSYNNAVRFSENVYVGKIISVYDEPVIEFTYYNSVTKQDTSVEMVKFKVQVLEVLKGTYTVGSIIEDKILYYYKEFLEKDSDYILMTCNKYSENSFDGGGYDLNHQPYSAMKLQNQYRDDTSLENNYWNNPLILFDKTGYYKKFYDTHYFKYPKFLFEYRAGVEYVIEEEKKKNIS